MDDSGAPLALSEFDIPREFTDCFARQRAAYRTDPVPTLARRILRALARLLKENQKALVDAVDRDRG